MTMAEAIHEVQVERRGSKRHRSPDGIFLVENAESRNPIGELLDISANGLAFVYSADVDAVQESEQLNVVSVSGEVLLKQIPYQNLNDFDYIRNYPFDAYRLRRRGVSFTTLTETQEGALTKFIKAIHKE
jgi:hypothetical protein